MKRYDGGPAADGVSHSPVTSEPSVEVGFGATGFLASSAFPKERFNALLHAAVTKGIRHFDTAGFYAGGQAEARLADGLRLLEDRGVITRRELTISTKIGKQVTESGRLVRDFRPETIERAVGRHCALFGGHPPDIVYMHGPDKQELHYSLSPLTTLRAEGQLLAVGVCAEGPVLDIAATVPDVDWIMGRYNFLNPRAGDTFQQAKRSGKKTVAIAPLAQALWRRSLLLPSSPRGLWYLARAARRQPRELYRAQKMQWFRNIEGWTPLELAIAFLRQGPVDVLLTSTGSARHIDQTMAALSKPIPDEIKALLSAHIA